MKVILVDDHKILIEGIARLLERDHDIVGIFTEPKQVLRFLEHHQADVLITDYEMPGMDGIKLFQECV